MRDVLTYYVIYEYFNELILVLIYSSSHSTLIRVKYEK